MSETLATLARMIGEILGDDADPDLEITALTSFSDDLELESIEFVELSEKLQTHYGDQLDFVGWLSDKQLDEIIQLKVGDVAEFIDRCLCAPGDGMESAAVPAPDPSLAEAGGWLSVGLFAALVGESRSFRARLRRDLAPILRRAQAKIGLAQPVMVRSPCIVAIAESRPR